MGENLIKTLNLPLYSYVNDNVNQESILAIFGKEQKLVQKLTMYLFLEWDKISKNLNGKFLYQSI